MNTTRAGDILARLAPPIPLREDIFHTSEPLFEDLGNLLDDGPFRVEGALAGDDERERGWYRDRYTFVADADEAIVSVDLESRDFDARVILEGPGDFRRSDDDGGPGTDSRVSALLPEAGTYTIVVTSYASDETGRYELRVASPLRGR